MKFTPAHLTPETGPDTKKKAKARAKAEVQAAKSKKPKRDGFFSVGTVDVDVVDAEVEHAKVKRTFRLIRVQVIVLLILTSILVFGSPFLNQTIYQYYAMDSSRNVVQLVALAQPNMTNQAVLSWASNSITEIMTFGFGDFNSHLISQQKRFTNEGWVSFVNAFYRMDIGQVFRERQLVLTTVPSEQPVILSQGPDPDHVYSYQWKVQMPIIMTYATNNNVTRADSATVELTIVRVPSDQSPGGIAIKKWVQ